MEQYRKKRKPINNFQEIQTEEIRQISNRINNKKMKMNFKLNLRYTMVGLLVFIIGLVTYPLLNNGTDPTKPTISLYKVSAQEYVIESEFYKVGFKAFAVTDNEEVIQYNDDFSYYKGMSKYNDLSHLIGSDIQIDLQLISIKDHNFIEVNYEGEKTYYEIIYSGYIAVSLLDGFNFIDFKEEMKNVLNLIEEYPPTVTEGNYIDSYTPNTSIDEINDQKLINHYKRYIENIYAKPVEESEYKYIIIANYIFNLNINEDTNEYTVENRLLHESTILVDDLNYDYSDDFYNPIKDEFEIILNQDYMMGGRKTLSAFDNDYISGEIQFERCISSDNEKYNDVVLSKLYIDRNELNKELGRIELKDQITGKVYEFLDIIEIDDYLFTMPIIVEDSYTTVEDVFALELIIYDKQGNEIIKKEISNFRM